MSDVSAVPTTRPPGGQLAAPAGRVKRGSKDWLKFETDVTERMREHWPDCRIEHNVKRPGHVSRRNRQIDVLVTGSVAGQTIEIVIECKRNATRPLGIGVVDAFAGKLQDIGAERGMIWTFSSFDRGARARAEGAINPKIELRTHAEYLAGLGIDAELFAPAGCPHPHCRGDMTWGESTSSTKRLMSSGVCSSCGTAAGKCPECSEFTVISPPYSRCDGCGARWSIYRSTEGDVHVDWELG